VVAVTEDSKNIIDKYGLKNTVKGLVGAYWAAGIIPDKTLPDSLYKTSFGVQEIISAPLYIPEALLYAIRGAAALARGAWGIATYPFSDSAPEHLQKAADSLTTYRVLHNEHLGNYLDQLVLPSSAAKSMEEWGINLLLPIVGVYLIYSTCKSHTQDLQEKAHPVSKTSKFTARAPKTIEDVLA
jgi:hypothetical protein